MRTLRIPCLLTIIPITFIMVLTACGAGPKSGRGFTLPEGNSDAGAQAFVSLQCSDCHSISGNTSIVQPQQHQLTIELGGEVARIQTYGELVTSIINPSHKLAAGYPLPMIADNESSKMRVYNDVMTVRQLCDLVTFLQSQYKLEPVDWTGYPVYQ